MAALPAGETADGAPEKNSGECLRRLLASALFLCATGMDESENPVLNVVRNVARLAALTQSGLLDSPPEEAFDRFTRLASHVLRARTALLSLVDEDRQFFKSAQGLSEPWATKRETPITHSICKHVVANASGVVLPDAKMDRVIGGCPGIDALRLVAYAGMPVRSIDGHVLGALCVMDDKRREWTTGRVGRAARSGGLRDRGNRPAHPNQPAAEQVTNRRPHPQPRQIRNRSRWLPTSFRVRLKSSP